MSGWRIRKRGSKPLRLALCFLRDRPIDPACRAVPPAAYLDPCRRGSDQDHDRQYPSGFGHRSGCRASVAKIRTMAALVRYIVARIIGAKSKIHPPTALSPPEPILIPAG